MFSDREVERYARHLVLREIGGPGQQKLKTARVLIAGLGGVGGPAAMYLAAAGVGRIGLVDDDTVALTNLHRQILYTEADVGRAKVEAGRDRLAALNADVVVEAIAERINADNARALVRGCDAVIDGTDSFETRPVVGEACVAEGATLVSAAIGRWDAQIAVLRARPCWRCFVPEIPPDAETCAAVGVVGALAGIAGSFAALAAIKLITGAGDDPTGQVLMLDTLNWRVRSATLNADPACPVCG